MDAFVSRKKRKSTHSSEGSTDGDGDDEPTEVKLAILSSLHPHLDQEALLDILLAHDGSVSAASQSLQAPSPSKGSRRKNASIGAQTSLRSFALGPPTGRSTSVSPSKKARLLPRRGATVHLFDPADVAEHTPCTIIHNFLPPDLADALLRELLDESRTFGKATFKLFDAVVSSPHTSSFYVSTAVEAARQRRDYVYNGAPLTDVRPLTPRLEEARPLVRDAVNAEVRERVRAKYPGGRKLRHQAPGPWDPNAAFVNCYDGPQESVGWHSDQLTYLGPRAVIGSLSLGVAREFRVRRVVPKDAAAPSDSSGSGSGSKAPDSDVDPNAEGQMAIHLPHNSLLVMHAEMQEEWKHSIAPAPAIDPHPVAGNRRINVTYRDYRASMHPRFTPRCHCGVAAVLRVVQKKRENWGRYFWMCYAGNVPGKESCAFFQWADFDDDGNPVWDKRPAAAARPACAPRSEMADGAQAESKGKASAPDGY
ncbi:Alpha-ketoglutarate-dependent dioxygenase alkB-like protein [Pleurostoma richardsiae]|uniref:Alpha-ketoglutarate-dependent dioxygenase alkB-like protein n=1 Tax=Pleurostoma richardsiae TaxID=41990 RepID=A0AA38RFR0_9PEZI|nr:Alpha-ketoglutarate-dependent dioxygenase alkB-like protein [Pleurostoma richardsiae]